MSDVEAWESGDPLYERPHEARWRHDFFSIKDDVLDAEISTYPWDQRGDAAHWPTPMYRHVI